ncbi:extracellular solute-binding protein [Ktedonospora formicarum]|uniref:extracellular solute-binding protein n=1 Tax=Ktedonospora formicarum TaxID=2778364 RepID=UPI001C69048F|nr:extracellular solute-binding protein [Ktedonospora formicarum]
MSINSPQALAALQTMTNWVETLSPSRVTDYSSESARLAWQRGEAVFMRNWPEAYFLANDATVSTVEGKFDIAPLPHGKDRQVSHSTLGGWSLAINASSTKPEAAWNFVHWMIQHDAQKQGAINAGWMPCLAGLYDDFDLTHKSPLFGKLKPILQDALPRPVSPRYTELSAVLRNHVFGVLKGWEKPQDALKKMEHDLRALQP